MKAGLMAKAKIKRNKITLRKYYKTKHWKELRNEYSYHDEAECEICHSKRYGYYKIGKKKGQKKPKAINKIHLHHKNYDNMYKETKKDLMLLCSSCHKFGHTLEKMQKRNKIYKDMYVEFKNKTGWEYKKR